MSFRRGEINDACILRREERGEEKQQYSAHTGEERREATCHHVDVDVVVLLLG